MSLRELVDAEISFRDLDSSKSRISSVMLPTPVATWGRLFKGTFNLEHKINKTGIG